MGTDANTGRQAHSAGCGLRHSSCPGLPLFYTPMPPPSSALCEVAGAFTSGPAA